MSTLREIEAVVESLPVAQQEALFHFLATRLGQLESRESQTSREGSDTRPHSVLDIPTVHVGRLFPISSDDDILGEMLEFRA
jgi:hypothetical protein